MWRFSKMFRQDTRVQIPICPLWSVSNIDRPRRAYCVAYSLILSLILPRTMAWHPPFNQDRSRNLKCCHFVQGEKISFGINFHLKRSSTHLRAIENAVTNCHFLPPTVRRRHRSSHLLFHSRLDLYFYNFVYPGVCPFWLPVFLSWQAAITAWAFGSRCGCVLE